VPNYKSCVSFPVSVEVEDWGYTSTRKLLTIVGCCMSPTSLLLLSSAEGETRPHLYPHKKDKPLSE
jgi:hypothetical protein